MTTLTQYEEHLETIAYTTAFSKAKNQYVEAIKGGREYSTEYGIEAMNKIIPVVSNFINIQYESMSFFDKPFLVEVLKPFTDKKVTGVKGTNLDRFSEMVAVNLVSNISSSPKTIVMIDKLITSFCLLANLEFEEAKDYNEQMIDLFFSIILEVQRLDIYMVGNDINEGSRMTLSPQWIAHTDELFNNISSDKYAYKPMVVKPLPHKDLISSDGGYLICRSPLLKHPTKVNGKIHPLIVNFTQETNPKFFEYVNKIQEVPYCVNIKLYEVLKSYYDKGMFFNDYPLEESQKSQQVEELINAEIEKRNNNRRKWAESQEGVEFKPLGKITERDIARKHKAKAKEDARKTRDVFEQCEYFAGFNEIYFPIFFDFRNRRYTYNQTGLTYQGTELSKALINHANKEAFTNEGIIALFETLANALGFDKESLKMKTPKAVDWWNKHKSEFMSGDFSRMFKEQDEFDEPINALAIVLELVEYSKDKSYKSGYIAHRDARCSGASIIGTLLEDAAIMELTSVLDVCEGKVGKLPDAYIKAADSALSIAENLGTDTSKTLVANKDELFIRSVFKTPVMTRCSYGLTDYSLREGNKTLFREIDIEQLGDEHRKEFNEIMINALDDALPSCSKYLNIMQKMGTALSKRDGVIAFTSPLNGFPFVMREMKFVKRKIASPVGFQRVNLVIQTPTNKVDNTAMKNGISPNIIHHVDSTLLEYVETNVDFPITCIHDSIGSHVNNCHTVVSTYAEGMYELYKSDFLNKVFDALNFNGKAPKAKTVTNPEAILTSHHILT
ncbi:MAG: DNA-directed RNA polymerase [Cetobacterium sp.]|uniref:DNA-directed RNA polymerase n=1 Tax=Cetobacterium sp. TaxID=2071632 RepID=UPI003EE75DDB